MATNSSIEWTDATWITCTGCNKVGPECDRCYAILMSGRQEGFADGAESRGEEAGRRAAYRGTVRNKNWTGKINLVPEALGDPFDWTWKKKAFVNSMSDTFHGKVPEDYILRMTSVMQTANWQTFQVLTKR